jgi:type II secretory pathway pseudopilin PulG
MSEPAHGVPLLRNDRGIVLILTLMVIMVLSVLATAFLFLSGTEINISRNSQVVTQAFYAAEAGIDTAINQLPNTTAINQTALGVNNAVFQTGPPPPAPPAPAVALGPNPSPPAGFNLANYAFNMYQVDVSGTVLVPRSDMQLRVGATIGTPMAGTGY